MRSPGNEPDEGDGKVSLVLSESSGELLSKVDGVKRWRVQPTMVRGWKKTNAVPLHVGKGIKSKLRRSKRVAQSRKAKGSKTQKEQKEQKEDGNASQTQNKKKSGHIPQVKTAADVTADDIRRSVDGHEAIRMVVQDIYEIDLKSFPSNPVFDAQGRCRMKFEGASSYTWSEVLQASPEAFEAMHLG